jgi:hypothetical protein
MLRATNHAGVTVCNRDRESGFKLPKHFICLPLPGDPRSNFHRLILLCHSNPVWIPVSPLELLSHPPTRCEESLKTIGTRSIPRCWHRSLYLLVFVSSAALVPAYIPLLRLLVRTSCDNNNPTATQWAPGTSSRSRAPPPPATEWGLRVQVSPPGPFAAACCTSAAHPAVLRQHAISFVM